jgi:hypothetical protein
MKKQNKTILWISIIATIVILIGLMVVFPIILDKSWGWFWIPAVIFASGWFIFGLIRLIMFLNKSDEVIDKIKVNEAVEYWIDKIKDDEYKADNLIVKEIVPGNYGDPNKGVTPVVMVICHATEKDQTRVLLINLNNYKEQVAELDNPTDVRIKEVRESIVDHPDKEIKERIMENPFMGMRQIDRTLPSSQKERDKIEEEKKEEKQAV